MRDPTCRAWRPQRRRLPGHLVIINATALLVHMNFYLVDLLRRDRSASSCRFDVPPRCVSTRPTPNRSLLTVTRSQSGDGQLWTEPESRGHGCRTADSRGLVPRRPTALGTTQTTTPTRQWLRTAAATQAAPPGALPPLCWRQTVWNTRGKPSCSCTGSNLMTRTCSPVASLVAEWAAFAEGWPIKTGRESRTWLPASWKADGAESGTSMFSAALTSDGRATGDHSHTSLLGLACYCLRAFGRPRSLSSVFFQPLSMLHPLGPSLSLKHPRAKVRSRTLNLTRKVSTPAGWRAEHHHQPGFGSAPCRTQGVPAACSSKARHLNHPNPTHISPHLSRAGPKSGTCLLALLTFQHLTETGGARVTPGSAPGVGLASAGKTRGEALPRVVTGGFPKHVKRAFRRARGRAARSLCGGTWYRGKWHDSNTLQALSKPSSRPVLPPLRVNRRPLRRSKTDLCMLSWNTSGLGGGVYQELLAWLEHPEHTTYQLVILQESHWHQVSHYCSGGWQCIHSSGFVEGAQPDRSSGLLIMLAKASFCDIATQELHAGRLLHVQATYKPTGLPITILALYQHVWRTQLSTSENLRLRGEILSSIKHILDHTPTRHHLVLAGDFSASLSPERACVGPAAPSPAHPNHCARLQQLLVDHQLVATNTWHAKPWHTYCSSEVSSQIDYVITRAADARGSTKHAAPLVQFPVAGWRQAGHWPIHARVCLQPYRRHPPQPHRFTTMCDVSALQQAVTMHTPAAQALQAAVAARLTQCHTCDPSTAQHEVNSILLEAAKEHFPSPPRADQRICAQPTFQTTAKHTWRLYAQMKARANATLPVVWLKWRAAVRFRQASLALRAQSRQLKRQALLDQVEQASAAADRGDQRALYMLVKRLAPRSFEVCLGCLAVTAGFSRLPRSSRPSCGTGTEPLQPSQT